MFGLTRREQYWKAQKKAAETVLRFAATVVEAQQAIRIKELEAEIARLKAKQQSPEGENAK